MGYVNSLEGSSIFIRVMPYQLTVENEGCYTYLHSFHPYIPYKPTQSPPGFLGFPDCLLTIPWGFEVMGLMGGMLWRLERSRSLACSRNSWYLGLDIQIRPKEGILGTFLVSKYLSGGVWMSREMSHQHDNMIYRGNCNIWCSPEIQKFPQLIVVH